MNANIMKRLEKEKEDNKTPGEFFYVQPLDGDMYTWHFTIRGVIGSPYETGLYHGRFILPKDYPLNPPDIYFANPSGRYQPDVKICLNITGYHKESWSPIWSLKKMMEAICAYFVCDEGGIGSVTMPAVERKKIAKESRGFSCKQCGALEDIEDLIIAKSNPNAVLQISTTEKVANEKPSEGKTTNESAKKIKGAKKVDKETLKNNKKTNKDNSENSEPEDLKPKKKKAAAAETVKAPTTKRVKKK